MRYRGASSLSDLKARLRTRLHESLQLSTLLPGDAVVASHENLPYQSTAVAEGDGGVHGGVTTPGPWSRRGQVLLGLLDVRALATMLASPTNPDRELWLRYLQARAPDLLCKVGCTPLSCPPPASDTAESDSTDRWLAELRGYSTLRWRRYIGDSQLLGMP